ncbi:hypothetical protein EZV62_023985 [Acer yangbiense]|uniref:Retroviral polymerase SH3-like domain-containing protein n=1 Tax=Acer yangbiense TaxID=1000413 RepID=A0A5C7H3H1_9ROSI|nr:hypothetical protein EZV62_023985 [Acer yangbiense]
MVSEQNSSASASLERLINNLHLSAHRSKFLSPMKLQLTEQQDQILLCWILSSISQDLLPQLVGVATSCEAWNIIERLFSSQSKANMMQLKLQLQTLKKGTSSMTEYLMKKKSLIDALLYSGNVICEDDKIIYVLGGLGPEYDPFVIPITSINGCYSLPEIIALLLTHEARLEQHTQSESLTINMAANSQNFNQNRKGNGVMQQYGNGRGHVQGNTQAVAGKIPFELLYKTTPNYDQVRVFWCLCYPYLRPYNKNKLQYRSTACVFLGYNPQYKCYKCISSTGRIYMARHVVFNEKSFPFDIDPKFGSGSSSSASSSQFTSSTSCLIPTILQWRPVISSHTQAAPFISSTAIDLVSTSHSHQSVMQRDDPIDNSPVHLSLAAIHVTLVQSPTNVTSKAYHQQVEQQSNLQNANNHPMITRAKAAIYKPKICIASAEEKEPTITKEALHNPK